MRLLRTEEIASSTYAFFFERPEGFEFTAGQFIEAGLPLRSPADPYRSFTIASAPCEPELMIATRIRGSAFKQALLQLQPGDDMRIDGPYGTFGLAPDVEAAHVLIAGGIGVTPFRSMLVQAVFEESPGPFQLFCVNRTLAETPFFDELTVLCEKLPALKLVSALTRPDVGWEGERGRLDEAMLARNLAPRDAFFYVSGPPAMVESTRGILTELDVAADRIRIEKFEGY